jgi:putative membrane protein
MTRRPGRRRIPPLCFGTFAIVWIALAIRPRYPADWFLENLITFFCVPLAVLTYRRFQFSDRAYVQATIFAILHTIGSHYTYSEVPIGEWLGDVFGLSRNHYDRIVHFAFGFLMLRPTRELVIRNLEALGPAAVCYLSLAAVTFWSLVYEVIEWLVASVADPTAGTAYLGTQGDVWDAQKDMALACVGALVGLVLEPAAFKSWTPRNWVVRRAKDRLLRTSTFLC